MKLRENMIALLIIMQIFSCGSNINTFNAEGIYKNFITVSNCNFQLEGKPYYYVGTNFWFGANIGANIGSKGEGGNRARLVRELDRLKAMGINNLRILGGSEGPDSEFWRIKPSIQPQPNKYNEDVLEGMDFLLNEMKIRNMYAVVTLNNFWFWSGGMAQYLSWGAGNSIPYPPIVEDGEWKKYEQYTDDFYNNKKAKEYFNNYIEYILNRTNKFNGVKYKNDSTIMSWELANEPRVINEKDSFFNWIKDTSKLIKSIDNNHLVTSGSEGTIENGDMFFKSHNIDTIDYLTFHLWIENWKWYNPTKANETYPNALKHSYEYINENVKIAKELSKPIVLEEFGIARDDRSYDPNSTTEYRDIFYTDILEKVYDIAKMDKCLAGVNFWAWGGEGRPRHPGAIWKAGDDFIGDPPHEFQGWYSVYDIDNSTIKIISNYAIKMNSL